MKKGTHSLFPCMLGMVILCVIFTCLLYTSDAADDRIGKDKRTSYDDRNLF